MLVIFISTLLATAECLGPSGGVGSGIGGAPSTHNTRISCIKITVWEMKSRGGRLLKRISGGTCLFFFVALNGQLVTTPIRFASSSAFWPFFYELIIYLFY